jgi:hypothetical protein
MQKCTRLFLHERVVHVHTKMDVYYTYMNERVRVVHVHYVVHVRTCSTRSFLHKRVLHVHECNTHTRKPYTFISLNLEPHLYRYLFRKISF